MKEACEKSTMASCSQRFLTFVERDTAVDAVDLESKIKFRWDLLLQHAVRSLVLQSLIVSLCYCRDGPPPDFSGIPDFFFFTSVEKKKT